MLTKTLYRCLYANRTVLISLPINSLRCLSALTLYWSYWTEWYTFPLWPEQNIQFQVFYINLKILTKDTYNAAFPKDVFSLVESRSVCEPWKWECLLSHHFVSVPRLYWNVMAKLVIGKSTLNHRQTSHSWTIFSLNLEHTSIAVETDY